MSHIIEKIWKHKDNTCVVLMTDLGHRCGYVGIQKGHPLFGLEYNEETNVLAYSLEKIKNEPIGKRGLISLLCWSGEKVSPTVLFTVHGGLTYSGGDEKYPTELKDIWWFGYDCAHLGDGKDMSVVNENQREYIYNSPEDIVRSLDYCIDECESLSNQLTEVTGNKDERKESENLASPINTKEG